MKTFLCILNFFIFLNVFTLKLLCKRSYNFLYILNDFFTLKIKMIKIIVKSLKHTQKSKNCVLNPQYLFITQIQLL